MEMINDRDNETTNKDGNIEDIKVDEDIGDYKNACFAFLLC